MANVNFFNKYDPKSQAKWFKYNDEDIEFLIAPSRNPIYKREMRKTFTWEQINTMEEKGFAEAFKNDKANAAYDAMHRLNAETLVFDWRNVNDENGNPVPFNRELLLTKMMDDEAFATWVNNTAIELLLERFKEKEEVVKN